MDKNHLAGYMLFWGVLASLWIWELLLFLLDVFEEELLRGEELEDEELLVETWERDELDCVLRGEDDEELLEEELDIVEREGVLYTALSLGFWVVVVERELLDDVLLLCANATALKHKQKITINTFFIF